MERLRVVEESGEKDTKKIEAIVDEDLEAFGAWVQEKISPDPLARSERAILKTYLAWKLLEKRS